MSKNNLFGRWAVGRHWMAGILLALAFVVVLAGCSKTNIEAKGGSDFMSADGDLVIPVSDITDKPSFFPAEVDGIKLEVLAVKTSDGVIRTAFNTCQVCYGSPQAYFEQNGDYLVCQNCGNRFAMTQVEVESGGCNPWPIFPEDKTVDSENITITNEYLKEATVIFENWKENY